MSQHIQRHPKQPSNSYTGHEMQLERPKGVPARFQPPFDDWSRYNKRNKTMILTNFILSAAATICLTMIVGMLAVMVTECAVKEKRDE